MDHEKWTPTLDLLAAVDRDADPRVAALAHVVAAVLLFDQLDHQAAERLVQALAKEPYSDRPAT